MEWDETKNRKNIEKHGLSFEQSKLVFDDPFVLVKESKQKDIGEKRELAIGIITPFAGRPPLTVVVVFTERNQVKRIMSARPAKRKERKRDEERKNKKMVGTF